MCFNKKKIQTEFYYNKYEQAIKYVEDTMSKKHDVILKVIGNQIIKNKNYIILGNTDKRITVHVRYHITSTLFGEKIILCFGDTILNISV